MKIDQAMKLAEEYPMNFSVEDYSKYPLVIRFKLKGVNFWGQL
jgi:hypothetical protein